MPIRLSPFSSEAREPASLCSIFIHFLDFNLVTIEKAKRIDIHPILADSREDDAGDPILKLTGLRLVGAHDQFVETAFGNDVLVRITLGLSKGSDMVSPQSGWWDKPASRRWTVGLPLPAEILWVFFSSAAKGCYIFVTLLILA